MEQATPDLTEPKELQGKGPDVVTLTPEGPLLSAVLLALLLLCPPRPSERPDNIFVTRKEKDKNLSFLPVGGRCINKYLLS
jgi:hypothetical protein